MTSTSLLKTRNKIAIISMSAFGLGNKGQEALEELARKHGDYNGLACRVREGDALPALENFDVLLSTGGPGDPTEWGDWGRGYADLIGAIHRHNENHPDRPKRAFLICHSFQIMSHDWGLGQITKRDSALWGIHRQLTETLPPDVTPVFPADDFYALESRFYQVKPTQDLGQKCAERDLVITAHDDQGAVTAWQTRDGHIAATQFHPEGRAADLIDLMDNRPASDLYCINMCPPQMIDDTRGRLGLLPVMRDMLVAFITRPV